MGFHSLPNSVLVIVFEYTRSPCHSLLREVSVTFKGVLDDKTNPIWNEMIKRWSKPLVAKKILRGSSVGCTALTMKSSKINKSCASCGATIGVETNPFYDLLLCTNCKKLDVFQIIKLKEACAMYFLNFKDMKSRKSLVKVVSRRFKTVLLTDVRKISKEMYPFGELERKISTRRNRRVEVENKRLQARKERKASGSREFHTLTSISPLRTDSTLKHEFTVNCFIRAFGSHEDVYGDTFKARVYTNVSGQEFGRREYEYACMLTHMKKVGLVGPNYEMIKEECPHPRHIFKYHLNGKFYDGGLHFYDRIRDYSIEANHFESRCNEISAILNLRRGDKDYRRRIAVAMCVEDDTDYDSSIFEDFVENGIGHPVKIAREIRKNKFLMDNNFAERVNHLVWTGYSESGAKTLATIRLLDYARGYPPMPRVCRIDVGLGIVPSISNCIELN